MIKIVPTKWNVAQGSGELNETKWIPAKVPGCIHYDLMAAGMLKNPYASTKNARDAAWVAESDWVYESVFFLSQEHMNMEQIALKVYGIDTYAELAVNDTFVGSTQDAYRIYEFALKKEILCVGENRLRVHILPFSRMIASRKAASECLKLDGRTEGMLGKALIRRYQRSFFRKTSGRFL